MKSRKVRRKAFLLMAMLLCGGVASAQVLVKGNVYGGCELGQVTGDASVTVEGGTIGTPLSLQDRVVDNNTQILQRVDRGNVYGGGDGYITTGSFEPDAGLVQGNTTVTVGGNAVVRRAVYGGGNIATVGVCDVDDDGVATYTSGGETSVTIEGTALVGPKLEDLTRTPTDDELAWARTYFNDNTIDEAKYKALAFQYLGGNEGWAFGGSRGFAGEANKKLSFVKTTSVTIQGSANVLTVFGGGENGHVQNSTDVTAKGSAIVGGMPLHGSGSITVPADSGPYEGASFTATMDETYEDEKFGVGPIIYRGNVFGGGKGTDFSGGLYSYTAGRVYGNSNVTVEGNAQIYNRVFGGGALASVGTFKCEDASNEHAITGISGDTGHAYVTIKGGTIGSDYDNVRGRNNGEVFGGSRGGAGRPQKPTETTLLPMHQLVDIAYVGHTHVTVEGGHILHSVYGGAANGHVQGNSNVLIKGTTANTIIGVNGQGNWHSNVYGGGGGTAQYTDTKPGTTETFTHHSITAGRVFGDATVNIQGGKVWHNVYGGGSLASVGTYLRTPGLPYESGGNTYVTITGGEIGSDGNENGMVFGSGRGEIDAPDAFMDSLTYAAYSHVTIGTEGGNFDAPKINGSVYGSGENGHVYLESHIDIYSGTIGCTATEAAALSDDAFSHRGNVYGAGCGTDKYDSNNDGIRDAYNPNSGYVQGVTYVNIHGGYISRNVYGGGAQATVGMFTKNATHTYVSGQSYQDDPSLSWPYDLTFIQLPDGSGNNFPATEPTGITNISITGGHIGTVARPTTSGDVYGAARGVAVGALGLYEAMALARKSIVTINFTPSGTEIANGTANCIVGSVYGSGENGSVYEDTKVTLTNGLIGGSIFGGGKGTDTYHTTLWDQTSTTTPPATIEADVHSITAGKVYGNTEVIMNNGTVKHNVYGGGNLASVGKGNYIGYGEMNNPETNPPIAPATPYEDSGTCTVTINGGTIGTDGLPNSAGVINGFVFGSSKGIVFEPVNKNPRYEYTRDFFLGYANKTVVTIGDPNPASTITPPTIHGSVFGGGEDGHVRWDTYVTVNKGTIGETYVASNPETDSLNKWVHRGNVYGAGRGIDKIASGAHADEFCSSAGSVTLNTTVTVKGGTIHRNVYGGGSNASVGPPPTGYNPGTSLCKVNIEGGTIGQKNAAGELVYGGHVFGAGRGHRDLLNTNNIGRFATSNETQVNIETGADVYGNVYGGGEIGQVMEYALVNMKNGTVEGSIFGGGKGEEIDEKAALVLGNATVDMKNGTVERSIYGGGQLGSVGTYTEYTPVTYPNTHPHNPGDVVNVPKTCDPATGLTTVKVSGGSVGRNGSLMPWVDHNPNDDDRGWIFCGGQGLADSINYYKAIALGVARSTYLEISNTSDDVRPLITASVYGGAENGLVLGDTHVKIAGGQIGSGCSSNTTTQNGVLVGTFDPIYDEAKWTAAIDAINNGTIETVLATAPANGGLQNYFHECDAWTFASPYNVYDIEANHYTSNGGALTGSDGHSFFGNVFGGGSGYYPIAPGVWRRSAGKVGGNTHVEITGGHILTSIYGGNETTDVMGTCTVDMSGGTLGVPRDSTTIAQHPTTCYLFGAGMGDPRTSFNTWSNVSSATVNVTGGTIFGSVFGGGEDGHVLGDVVVNIGNDATKSPLIGTLGYSYVDGNVFGGGRGFQGMALTAGVVRGNVEVNINGGTMLGSIYGGGRLAPVGTYLVEDDNANYGKMMADVADNPETPENEKENHGHIKVNIGGTNQKSDITIGNNHESRDHYVDHIYGGNVYGGGMGRLEMLDGTTNTKWHQMGRVKNTVVNIGEKTGKSTVIKGDVFGGGEMGTVGGEVTNTTDWHGTKVNISGGTLWFDVFGGGHGSENLTKLATISTSPLVEVTPAQMAGLVFGNTNVNVSGGWVKKSIYGGGELASVGIIVNDTTTTKHTGDYALSWPYEFEYKDGTGIDSINITGGRIGITGKDYFGPWAQNPAHENKWEPIYYSGTPAVANFYDFTNSTDKENFEKACLDNGDIYGGSKGMVGPKYVAAHRGNVSATVISINIDKTPEATPLGYKPARTDTYDEATQTNVIKYMAGYYPNWSAWTTWVDTQHGVEACVTGAVYGGAEDGHVNGDTKITLEDGLIGHAVYGGGKGKGKYNSQYVPTAGKVYGDTYININGGYVVRSVFGGGNLASVGKGNYIGYGETATNMTPANTSGRTYVNIYGGQLGTLNPSKPSDVFKDNIPYGSVFGGCRGQADGAVDLDDHRFGFVNNSFVTIGENVGNASSPRIYGSVYGGAQDGHVRRNTKVTVNNGEIGVEYGATPQIASGTMGIPTMASLTTDNLLNGNIGLDDPNWTDRGNVFGGGSGLGLLNENGSTTVSSNYAVRAGCVFETTEVEIKGGLIHRGVYGGGNLASVLGLGTETDHDKVKVTVSDNAKVGLQTDIAGEYYVIHEVNHETVKDTIYFSYGGNVFGAGKGFASDDFTTFCNVINTDVTISGGNVYGDVYGGGENGHVTDSTDVKITTGANIGLLLVDNVNGGTWGGTTTHDGNVFGGGMGSGDVVEFDPAGHPDEEEFRIYKHCGRVGGNTRVTMDGGTIQGTIFGGGRLALVGVKEDGEPYVTGTTYDSIVSSVKRGLATIDVSAGSIGNPNGDKLLNGSDESVGDIFGAGKGDLEYYEDILAGRVANSKINITGSPRIYGSVFGGGEMASIGYWYTDDSDPDHPKSPFYANSGTSVVTIGRANQSDNPEIGTDMEFRYDYANGNPSYWTVFDDNHKLVHSCTGNVYGGSQGDVDTIAGHWVSMARSRRSYVTINGGIIKSRVFGGAEQGSVAGDTRVTVNGGTIGSWANTDDEDPTNNYLFGGVYGGGYGSHNPKFNGTTMQVNGVTTAVVNDSTTYLSDNLWTANYLAGRVYGNTRVDVLGGEIKGDVYGGASFAYIGGYGSTPKGNVFLNIGKMVSANNYEGEARIYGSVYGSNNNSGTPYGNVVLNVYKTAHWDWTENEVNYTNFVPSLPSGCDEWTHELLNENTNGTGHFTKTQGYAIKEVFGGGNRANYIPNMTARGSSENARSTTVRIWSCDNTIEDVYGGSNASSIGTSDKNADINLTVDGGRFKRIFSGGNGRVSPSNVYGWANNSVNGGIVEEVYGGGNAEGFILHPNLTFNEPAASGCTEYIDEVYGGSNEAPIVGEVLTTIECGEGYNYEFYGGTHEAVIYGNVTLNVFGGRTEWLFGGSRGTDEKPAPIKKYPASWEDIANYPELHRPYLQAYFANHAHDGDYGKGGNVTVNLYGGTVTNVFGGSDINGNIEGQILVNVIDEEGSCPLDITNLYGGGNITDYEPVGHTTSTPVTSPIVNVVHIKEKTATATNPYIPGIRGNVFGASLGSEAEVKANPVVNIGYNTSLTGIPSAYLDRITNSANPHPITPRVLVCGNVYGGGNDGPVDGTTTVNVYGGEVGVIEYQKVGTEYYNWISHTSGGNVFGGGQGNLTNPDNARVKGNSNVNMSGGIVYYNVYGGGEMSSVGQHTVVDGDFVPVDNTGLATVNITGGQVGPAPRVETVGSDVYKIPIGVTGLDGYVFGGGKGHGLDLSNLYKEFANVNETEVTVNIPMPATEHPEDSINNRIWGSVFGGAEDGHVLGSNIVKYQSGYLGTTGTTSYDGNIFGGGRNYSKQNYTAGRTRGNNTIEMTGGQIFGNIYGGGRLALTGIDLNGNIIDDEAGPAGAKFGKTLVQVKGGIVGNNRLIETFSDHSMGSVYGGGMGNLTEGLPSPHPAASILLLGLTKNTEVRISEEDPDNHPTHVYGVVFGGGEIANVGKYTWDVDYTTTPVTVSNIHIEENTGLAKVSVSGGVIGGDRTRMRYDIEIDPSDLTQFWLKYNDDLGYVYGGGEGWSDDPDSYDKVHAEGLEDPETSLLDLISTVNNTEVEISGGWVKASVFGGAESGHVRGNTKVTISGGQIGAGDDGTEDKLYTDGTGSSTNQFINPNTTPVTDENSLDGTAHWDYEAPYHPFDPAKIRNQYNASTSTYGYVPCDGRSWFGNVFGGGSGWFPYVTNEGTDTEPYFVSHWNSNSGRVWGNTEVIIEGGHILNNVYGGNEATDVGDYGVANAAYNTAHPSVHVGELYCKSGGTATVTISGGTIGVPRTVSQVMDQPITSCVFGGGAGDPRIIFNDKNNVDTTDVHITGGIIYGSVYGGAEQGHVVRGTSVRINEAADKTIVIGSTGFSGYDGCVFGGGKGDETIYDSYPKINANPPTIPNEIPAHPNFACGRVGGTSKVAMSKGTVLGNLYGGGMIALTGVGKEFTGVTGDNGDGFWSFINGPDDNKVYDSIHHGLTQVVLTGGTIGNHVNDGLGSLLNTRTVGNVFGGGRGKIDEFVEDDFGRSANAIVNISNSDNATTIYGSVFGGGQMANVGHWNDYATWYSSKTGTSRVTITGSPTIGTAKEFDNGYATGTGTSTPINTKYETINNVRMISHTSTGSVYGGGQGNVNLKNNRTVVGLEQGHCRTTDVNISGTPTIMSSVFGGSEQGAVWGDTKVVIAGGTIGKTDVVSHRWDDVNHQWVNANTPYYFGSVFGGSYGSDKYTEFPGATTLPGSAVDSINALAGRVYGNASVSITGGIVRGNVFGGGDMASVGDTILDWPVPVPFIDLKPKPNTGHVKVSVSGTAIIGPLDGTGLNGYVFGGGKGMGNDSDNLRNKYCNVNSTEVIVNLMYAGADPDKPNPESLWNSETDGRIYGSVYGGGSSSHVLGDASVTINGGVIGTYDAVHNTITDWGGNVFGSGRNFHMTNYAAGRVAGNTTVEMYNGVVYGSIFGGGRNAVTGTGLDGTTMRYDVGTTDIHGKTTVKVKGGTVGYKPLVISFIDRPIGEVFGGGKGSMTPFPGHPDASPLLIAMVKNTEVEISQADADVPTYVLNSVYGGGEVGSVGHYTWVQDPDTHVISEIDLLPNTGTTNVTIKGGRIGVERMVMSYELKPGTFLPASNPVGNVFGGGKGTAVDPTDYPSGINTTRFGNKYLVDLLASTGTTTVVVENDGSKKPWVKSSVYGGSACGRVVGNTNVTIAGGQIGAGDSGSADLAPYTDDQFVDASSTTITDGNALKPTCHWDYDPNTLRPFDLVAIHNGIDGSGHYNYIPSDGKTWYGNVFGGGSGFLPYVKNEGTELVPNYVSHWNRESGRVYGNSTVTITGGHILSSVYGGCEVSDVGLYRYDETIHGDVHETSIEGFASNGTATITMSGGTVGVPRTTSQIQGHPIPGYIYGSGKGDPRIYFNTWTNVNTSVVTVTGGKIYGCLFGGGEDGHVMGDVTVSVNENNGNTIIGSTGLSKADGNIFGGGRGTTDEAHTAGSVGGNVSLTVTDGTMLGNIYGGGNRGSVGIYLVDAEYEGSSGMEANPYYGTFQGEGHGTTTVTVSGGTIGTTTNDISTGHVFGGGKGSNKKDTSGDLYKRLGEVKNTDVTINASATVNGSVYGGGENGQVNQDTKVTIAGNAVIGVAGDGDLQGYVYGGGRGVDPYNGTSPAEDNPYAGRVSGTTRVNINDGTVTKHVFGGGEKGLVNTARIVNINGGTVKGHVLGGNNLIPVAEGFASISLKTVNVRGGAIEGSVFGGSFAAAEGNAANTWNSFVNITGGTIGYSTDAELVPSGNVYAAGYGGEVDGSVSLNVGLTAVKEAPNHSANIHYQDGLDNTDPTLAKVKIQGNLFDGSYQYQTTPGQDWLYEFDITGHSNMYIDGYGYNTADNNEASTPPYMNIGGGLYGGGNYCESGALGRKLILRNYGTRNPDGNANAEVTAVSRTLTTLQRAGIALIDNSNIQFTGAPDLSQRYEDRDRFGVLTVDDGLYVANGSSFVLGTDIAPAYMDSIKELKSLHLKSGTSYQHSDAYNDAYWEWIGVNPTDPTDPSANIAANARLYYKETSTTPLTFAQENAIVFNGDSRMWVRYKNPSTGDKVKYGELQGFFRVRADQFTPQDNKSFAYARPKLTSNVNPIDGYTAPINNSDGGFLSYVTTYNDFTKYHQKVLGYTYEHEGDDGGSDFTKTKQYPYYNFAQVTAKGDMEEYRAWVLPLIEGHIWYVDGRGIGSTTHGWGQDKSHEFGWGDRPDKPKQTITKNDPDNNTYGIFYDPSTLSQFNPNRFNPEKDIIFVVGPVQALVENGDLNPSMSNLDPTKRYQLKLYRYPGGHLMSNGQVDATTSANPSTHVPMSTDYNGLASGLTDGPGANLGAMVDVNNTTGNFVMENVLVDGMFREGSFTSEEILAYSIPASYYNTYTYNETQHPAEKLNVSEPLVVTNSDAQLTLKGGTTLQHGYNGTDGALWYNNPDYTPGTGVHHGGALYVDGDATVNVEGLVTIEDNLQKKGTGIIESNVYLPTFEKSLTISNVLNETASIGVTSPQRNAEATYQANTFSPVAKAVRQTNTGTPEEPVWFNNAPLDAQAAWEHCNFTDDQGWFFANQNKFTEVLPESPASPRTTYYVGTSGPDKSLDNTTLYFGWTWASVVRSEPSGFSKTNNIDSPEDLAWLITALPTGELKQTADLDMGQYVWVPIGDNDHKFTGSFDGQGHLIKNLNIDYIGTGDARYERTNYGLFGNVGNATIDRTFVVSGNYDPVVTNLNGSVGRNIGGLVGYMEGSTVVSSSEAAVTIPTSTTKFDGTVTGNNMGGLVGMMAAGEVHSSMAMPDMSATANYFGMVGGLVGKATDGQVNNSFVNGKFYIHTSHTTATAGGLMGNNTNADVKNCYVTWVNQDATLTSDNFGSLAASTADNKIDKCYVMENKNDQGNMIFKYAVNEGTVTNCNQYSPVMSADNLGYMYYDNVIPADAYFSNDTAMFGRLNKWVDRVNKAANNHKYARWARPGLGKINGDLPVLMLSEFDGSNAYQGGFRSVGTYAGGPALQYGGTARDEHELDEALIRTKEGTDKDCLFVYGDVNSVSTGLTITQDKVSIYEHASIKSPGTLASFGDTYVGISFDNSCGHAVATMGVNYGLNGAGGSLLPRDWHMFSTPLSNAPQGFDYQDTNEAVSSYSQFNSVPYSDAGHYNNPWFGGTEFGWLSGPGSGECIESAGNRYWMGSADGYFPTSRGSLFEGNENELFIIGSDECPQENKYRYPYGMDFYTWTEPDYHWINFKRNGPNHWHTDGDDHKHIDYQAIPSATANVNEETLIPGKGYLGAITKPTFMQSHGSLNAAPSAPLTIPLTEEGKHLKGWNLVGNPFHGYIDFDRFSANANNTAVLQQNSSNQPFYVVYDADTYDEDRPGSGFLYQPKDGSNGGEYAGRYIHPHQGFYVKLKDNATSGGTVSTSLQFTEGMLVERANVKSDSHFRGWERDYPLVNLYLSSDGGCRDVTVIELDRPEWGGATKLKELRVGNGLFYGHHGDNDYAAMFVEMGTPKVPLWFEAKEDDIYTMTWNTANGNFHSMYLIDNITGIQYDMLKNNTYRFEGHKGDYWSRFYIVFDVTDVEENVDEPFVFFDGSEWVVTGEGDLEVIDVLGHVLQRTNVEGQARIALNNVAEGLYLMRLTSGKQCRIQKVVVTR